MAISERIPGAGAVNKVSRAVKANAPEIEVGIGVTGSILMGVATLDPDGAQAATLSWPIGYDTLSAYPERVDMPEKVHVDTDQVVFALLFAYFVARIAHGVKDINRRRHLDRYKIRGLD